MTKLSESLSRELHLKSAQVEAAAALLQQNLAVPFLARYCRRQTGGLNEEQLFALSERLKVEASLEARRKAILSSLAAQGKLTEELRATFEQASTREELEDLFLPFSPREDAAAVEAQRRGLEPLAQLLRQQPVGQGGVEELASAFLSAEKGVAELAAALRGAREIVAARLTRQAAVRSQARRLFLESGQLTAQPRAGVDLTKTKFAAYARFSEALGKLPSHRLLAVLRGEAEKKLEITLAAPRDQLLALLREAQPPNPESPFAAELSLALEEALDRLLLPALESELRKELKRRADEAAANLFARNLCALLLQPPFGPLPVLALTPGPAGSLKAVLLDGQGRLLEAATLQPSKDEAQAQAAREKLAQFFQTGGAQAVALAGGKGQRACEVLAREVLSAAGLTQIPLIPVSEAGAAAFGESRQAKTELPALDLHLRAAVFIGRRLQDPLRELVKLNPRSIGVGQYQHDVDGKVLRRKLEEALQICVNRVGVDVNTAGIELLAHVAGLNLTLARQILAYRESHGPFKTREELKAVPALTASLSRQAAGFLKVSGGTNPLDLTAVHPDAYPLVEKIAGAAGRPVGELIGNAEALAGILPAALADAETEEGVWAEILRQLKEAGRDPRGPFLPPVVNAAVTALEDLREGQVLDGVVTNLTAFGAFVDLGVQQDGLVHISELSHRFVRDPAQFLSVGKRVKVQVRGVDLEKKRISLSMKALQPVPVPEERRKTARPPRPPRQGAAPRRGAGQPAGAGPAESAAPAAAESPTTPTAASQQGVAQTAAQAERPAAGERRGRGRREERPARKPETRERDGERKGRGRPAGPPVPGKPDLSKFFIKPKSKEKGQGRRRNENEASRDDIRQTMQKAPSSGIKLGSLLKDAGLEAPESS